MMAGPAQSLDDSAIPSNSTVSDNRVEGMLAVVKEMKEVKEKLDPKPSLESVIAAEKAISDIEHRLIEQLQTITHAKRPYGVESEWFSALQAMKEDRVKRDADLEKLPHTSVVELNNFHRHYEAIISQAEQSILEGGVLPTGLRNDLQVGKYPRIIHYPTSAETEVAKAVAPLHQTVERRVEAPILNVGGLSSAFQSTQSSGELAPIPEIDLPVTANPKLVAMIEDAEVDKREKFSISEFGALTWIPETIGSLAFLTHLDLSGNRLKYLPSSLGNLPNLKLLDLYGNQLTELPETLGNLSKLLALDFHSNRIEELPVSIGGCGELVELVGDLNRLRGLPESLGQCQNLQKISFALNQLSYLPKSLGNLPMLIEIDVHYNQLEGIPDSLCQLASLEKLNVAAQHASLTEIPVEIGNLVSLVELNISECQIHHLPDSLVNLTNLKKLEVQGNPLNDPPMHVAQNGKEAIFEYISSRKLAKSNPEEGVEIHTGVRGFFRQAVAGTPILGRRKGNQTPKGDGFGTTPKSYSGMSPGPGSSFFSSFMTSHKGGGGSSSNSANQSPTRGTF